MALTIMAVDDEQDALKFMKAVVVPLGHTFLTFADSRQAAERIDKQRFDVIFVDMRMPDMDGFELTKRILESQPNRETAIVMLTGAGDVENLRKALAQGVTLFLAKPVTPARLTSLLRAMEQAKWKDQRHSARLPLWAQVSCQWGDKQVTLRTVNISETGLLVQPSVEAEVGQEVSLEFTIAEVRASIKARAKVVRKEGADRAAVEFVDLKPEDRNAIELYIMGRLKEQTSAREGLRAKPARLWRPTK